jgi:DNA recombination protein RmuC
MDPVLSISLAVALLLLGLALGILVGRYVWPAVSGIDPTALALAQANAARKEQECSELRSQLLEVKDQSTAASDRATKAAEEAARLNERVAGLTRRIEEQTTAICELEAERDRLAAEGHHASVQIASLTERERALAEKISEQSTQLATLQTRLTTEFENISNRVLKANASELSEISERTLKSLLDPLRDRINEFQNKVEQTYKEESREVLSLKEQIRAVLETSHAIGNQADGLAKALRGDSQLLGRWGELALERILEAAGLTAGREYITQGRGLGLRNEDGGIQRPDVIVILPEQRTIIIDSKISLASYERLITAQDEIDRDQARTQFVRDMRTHIDGLSGKRYQENNHLQAHDAVLMFVPVEGALAAALTSDPDLFSYAWQRSVVLVGPPTLLMTMRTVASVWKYEKQAENAQEIARLAGVLCDKISMSLADFQTVTERLQLAATAHNDALKRLATGKGNVISIGKRIRELGVAPKRQVPKLVIDGVAVALIAAENGEFAPDEVGDEFFHDEADLAE